MAAGVLPVLVMLVLPPGGEAGVAGCDGADVVRQPVVAVLWLSAVLLGLKSV